MDLSALIFAALKSAKTANERIDALPLPMVFKGTLGTGGTISTLPTASSENEGFVYIVITDGTYAGQSAKAGDTFVSDGSSWVLVPSADEPSVIDDSVTSTALTWSSKKISDECKIKTLTYTGNGESTNDIVFPVVPTLILFIGGTGYGYNSTIPFAWGAQPSIYYIINSNTVGGTPTARNVGAAYNDKTLTITGTNEQSAFNVNGTTYTLYYI